MVRDGPRSTRVPRPRRRLLLIAACAAAAFVVVAGIAAGAVGDLTYAGCITGEQGSGPSPGTGACAAIPGITSGGGQSGIDNPQAMALSPDGKSLYLASGNDAAVGRFDRDPATGALTYQGCITGETGSGPTGGGGNDACAAVTTVTTSNGFDSGLDNLRSIAVSSDGVSVYAVSGGDDSIVRFDRNTTTGALTYQGCITGETESVTSGACTAIPDDAAFGSNSGLDFLTSVAVSPDGTSVYVSSEGDDAIARFSRNTSTGALGYQGCVTGESDGAGGGGTDVCTEIPDASPGGGQSGLDAPTSLVVSPDSEFVYATSLLDDAVVRFDRDTAGGAIAFQSCTTGETESVTSGACTGIPSATSFGADSGLDFPLAIALGPGGSSLYAVAHDDDALARFTRDIGTGALTYQSCITGRTESGPTPGTGACSAIPSKTVGGDQSGLDQLYSLATSADGRSVYAVSQGDDGVVRFARDAATGAVTYQGCTSGEQDSGPSPGTGACALIPSATGGGGQSGLDKPRSLAVSSDNKNLYAGSPADDAVSRFGREQVSGVTPPTPPPDYKETCFGITVDGKTATGGNGNDTLDGTKQSDLLRGAGGNDKIRGDDAADCLFGNAGKDKVSGEDGDDVIRGGSGDDNLSGGKDDDTIRAQDGNDKAKGGAGDDFIKAQGRGSDEVNCGGGDDRVIGDVKDKIAASCERVKLVDPH